MSTTVVINEVPKFNLSVQQGDGPAVTLSQPDAPALTLSMSGPQGPTGATGAAGPNSVTSSTTSDGTGTLSLSSLSLSTPLPLASGGTGGTTAGTARTNLGLGTADTPTFSNLTLNTGTITVPQPLSFSQTWNAAAMTFSAFQMNVTDTASNAASTLMDLRVGGNSKFSVRKDGYFSAFQGSTTFLAQHSASWFGIYSSQSSLWGWISNGSGIRLEPTASLGWANALPFGAQDLTLLRDAANTLAQRNGANAQEFRLYGTTNAGVTEYERLKLKYNSTTLSYQIGTEKGGTTTSARPLEFQTDGITRMIIGADGVFTVDGVKVGRGAGAVSSNTALGNLALNVNTTGSSNTALGNSALFKNTTGIINTAVGSNALPNNTTGSNNSAVGSGALLTNSTGSNNSAVGSNSLFSNTTGSNNVALGNTAGRYIADGSTANAVTTNSLYIGADTKALASGQTNQIVIGHNAIGIGTNTVVLGNDSIATTALKGSVGIGTTNPVSKLEVVSITSELPAGNGILRFSTSTGSNDRGNKIGAVAGSGSDGYSYWQAVRPGIASDGNISINPLGGSVGIGSTTPTALLDVNSDTFRLRTARTPASATAAGNAGDICWDSNYIYICTATNTWKRAAIATWP